MPETPYDVLRVDKSATEKEIKKSYRRLALIYHPDKYKADKIPEINGKPVPEKTKDEFEEKFKKVNNAYHVLSDKERRDKYDQFGITDDSEMPPSSNIFNDFFNQFAGGNPFGEGGPFGHVFGSMFGHSNQPQKKRTMDSQHTLNVTLEEVYTGKVKHLNVVRRILCPECDGVGGKHPVSCADCGGQGHIVNVVRRGPMVQHSKHECSSCQGSKVQVTKSCKVCKGQKVVNSKDKMMIELHNTMMDGHQIVAHGKSHEKPGCVTGDIVFTIKFKEHKTFKIERGDNLYTEHKITLADALAGFEFKLTHLDGRILELACAEITAPNEIQKIKKMGFNENGHLYIKFLVQFPRGPVIDRSRVAALFDSHNFIGSDESMLS